MAEWTPEARRALDGYLRKVAALATSQGDDAEEIVTELREHIAREAEEAPGGLVTMEHLNKTLAATGTPEQVTGAEGVAAMTPPVRTAPLPPPPLPRTPKPARRARWPWLVPLWIVVLVPLTMILIAILSVMAAIFLPALARAREAAARASCQNNLKQVGLCLVSMYAEEHDGMLPPLDSRPGRFMFRAADVHPKYIGPSKLNMLICPRSKKRPAKDDPESVTDDHSYIYLGYAVTDEEEGEEYINAYRKAIAEEKDVSVGLVRGDGTPFIALNAKESLFSSQASFAQSEVPVLIERLGNHAPGGGNVLFLDGHVEFIRMNSRFPMTERFLSALETLESTMLENSTTLSRARGGAARAECQNNLKQVGLFLHMYANDHDGMLPPLDPRLDRFMFRASDIHPKYFSSTSDLRLLTCPQSENKPTKADADALVDDHSYIYLGYAVTNEAQGRLFIDTYLSILRRSEGMFDRISKDVLSTFRLGLNDTAPSSGKSSDPSEIPVLIERPGNHTLDGGNVLFLDGHVEFIKMNSKFPMKDWFLDVLKTLEERELDQIREEGLRVKCANNLKQMGILMCMFANEQRREMLPPLDPRPGRFMFQASAVYPRYTTGPSGLDVLTCPKSSAKPSGTEPEMLVDDHSYFYLGYAVRNEAQGMEFVKAYRQAIAAGADVSEGLTAADGAAFQRLTVGAIDGLQSSAEMAAARAEIPIFIERPCNHVPRGGNVCFLDGHVEFILMDKRFPMTEKFLSALESLEQP